MRLDAKTGHYGPYKHVVVDFNATNVQVTFANAQLAGMELKLHPVQERSSDP